MIDPIEHVNADVLVLGGGIGGYRAAIAARQRGAGVTMAYWAHGASPYVIGFNAPIAQVDDRDSPEVFAADMLRGGCKLNDPRLLDILTRESIDAFEELAALGVPFARRDGHIDQRHLSGNTYPRSVYVAQSTGGAILASLKRQARKLDVNTINAHRVVDLLVDEGDVVGALLWRPQSNVLTAVHARATVLATGGIGRLYGDSTYPVDVAADGLGMALDVGARLVDMEFVQFEPVVTVWPEACRGMEMPTAMLGDGAQLRNALGERFMMRLNPPLGERGIEKARMALYVQQEIDEGRGVPPGGVLFDTTLLPADRLESYVTHCSRLRAAGVDPARQAPIVAPAAHSIMGGVAIDAQGWSGVPGLYVGGEAAGGVHGASRLAGNGCADTLVFGAVAGRGAALGRLTGQRDKVRIATEAIERLYRLQGPGNLSVDATKHKIRSLLSQNVGLWRNGASMRSAQDALEAVSRDLEGARGANLAEVVELKQARLMALIARTIIAAALARRESRGAHQRTDYPQRDDENWLCRTSFRRGPGATLIEQTETVQE